jgi:hypothetical protein
MLASKSLSQYASNANKVEQNNTLQDFIKILWFCLLKDVATFHRQESNSMRDAAPDKKKDFLKLN